MALAVKKAEVSKHGKFRFRNHDHIGAAAAEQDDSFLRECFVDTGELDILLDCVSPHRIVLGRTGAGKTALLSRFSDSTDHVICVKPESLSLAHISNSTILRNIHDLGVNLDIFFKLLWRHVFTVEIIKAHFKIDSADRKTGLYNWVETLFNEKRKKHKQALNYLETWGKDFWEETDYRIKELTTKLESELKDSISTSLPSIANLGISDTNRLSQEQKLDVIQRAQHVVNKVQIRELSEIIELLDEVLDDPQKRYYILIDRLDENWVEDGLRNLLIRALIETVKDFSKVRHAKIVIALRYDLIDRVVRLTRDAGFQEEKYESLYLRLSWTKEQLIELIDRRVDHLVRQRYTNQRVKHSDILPTSVDKQPTMDYILERTFMRPRDVISFFNMCISHASSSPKITPHMIKEAEGEYSRQRLRYLADEWHADYPALLDLTDLLKNRRSQFSLSEISDDQVYNACLSAADGNAERRDELTGAAVGLFNNEVTPAEFRRIFAVILYRIGMVGLKQDRYESFLWTTDGRVRLSSAEVSDETRVAIHPCFWRTLGVHDIRRVKN